MTATLSARDAIELAAAPTLGELVAAAPACPCGTTHRTGSKIAEQHAAAFGPKLPAIAAEDVLGTLSLLDGRLVVLRSGAVMACSPSRFQDAPLPGQIADHRRLIRALDVASDGGGRALCERMNRATRAQLPLATAIPEQVLAAVVDLLLEDLRAAAPAHAA